MKLINKYSKSIWIKEENKFSKLESKIKIPNSKLNLVDSVILKNKTAFLKIPEEGGCYWIWTNESVFHQFHKKPIPKKIFNGEIIYNGIAKDNICLRIKHHLLGELNAGWSGVSMDLYPGESESHKKKAYSLKHRTKVPYIINTDKKSLSDNLIPIRSIELLLNLYLSKKEKEYIQNNTKKELYFRNGINIFENKHKRFKFKVFYIVGLSTQYLDYIEKKWRKKYNSPKLCSYSSGR